MLFITLNENGFIRIFRHFSKFLNLDVKHDNNYSNLFLYSVQLLIRNFLKEEEDFYKEFFLKKLKIGW